MEPELIRYKVLEPILLLGYQRFQQVDIRVRVKGGGYVAQIYAIRQAVAKALVAFYQKYVDEQSKQEIKEIADKADIPLIELEETLDKQERPKVIDLQNYSLLIFSAPISENSDIITTPVSIFLSKTKNNVITVRLKDIDTVTKIKQEIAKNKTILFENGTTYFVYRLLDEILHTYFAILDQVEETIDKVEDRVLVKPDKKVVERIFETKKSK